MSERLPVSVRSLGVADLPFVFQTWLHAVKRNSIEGKRVPEGVFYAHHHRVIEAVLALPTTQVFVATPDGEPGVIVGYLVSQPTDTRALTRDERDRPVVHFAYTKGQFRRLGVLGELLRAARLDPSRAIFTAWTKSVDWMIGKWPDSIYVPYLASAPGTKETIDAKTTEAKP